MIQKGSRPVVGNFRVMLQHGKYPLAVADEGAFAGDPKLLEGLLAHIGGEWMMPFETCNFKHFLVSWVMLYLWNSCGCHCGPRTLLLVHGIVEGVLSFLNCCHIVFKSSARAIYLFWI